MNVQEMASAKAEEIRKAPVTVWNETTKAFLLNKWERTEKAFASRDIFKEFVTTVNKAVKNWKFNEDIPFKLPYELYRLEPQLAPAKKFFREKGVVFHTERARNGNPCIIWFRIPWTAGPEFREMIEACPEPHEDSPEWAGPGSTIQEAEEEAEKK